MDAGLRGARVLVTGASGGIGGAVAAELVAVGASPILHYCRSEGAARALQARLVGRGAAAPPPLAGADLRDEGQVDALFAQVTDSAPLDAIVVNAGIWIEARVPLHHMSLAQWEETMAADLRTAFLTCRGYLRHLEAAPREDAAIVFVASTAGLFGEAGHADYASAKAAMAHGLTASLKNEIVRLAPRGRVNCVCPGWTRTPMAEGALGDSELVARALSTVALRKVAEPEDVARAVVWFLSPTLSGHVSGAVLPVAGGMEGRRLH
ncbi:MAG: SDR family oxidoreductase [Planctomycetota bacterium]